MKLSGLLIFNSDDMHADCREFATWTGVKISDRSSFDVEFHFDGPGHARKAQRLADAINAAMCDPSNEPAERAKLAAILAPAPLPLATE